MGFSLKDIGKFIDGAYEIKKEIKKEASKEIDRNLKKVGRFIDEHYDYVNVVENAIEKASSYVVTIVKQLVDLIFIRDEVKKKCPQAFRAKILAKKRNAVDVGIFANGSLSQHITIESEIGISDDIYRGQVIELSC